MRRIALALTLALVSTCAAQAQDSYTKLPAGPGRDVMVRVCSQCHSPELVTGQNLDAAGWKDLVGQMQSNGASASDAEFDQIAAYLTASFPKK